MNDNLFMNVDEFQSLLDNIKEMNPELDEFIQEIIDLTFEIKWVEIKTHELCR